MPVEILVVCTHKDILDTIIRLIHTRPDWKASGVSSIEQAKQAIINPDYKIVLIGSGIDDSEIEHFAVYLSGIKPEIKIVKHYGGGSGLLFGEINHTLQNIPPGGGSI